MPRSGAVTPRSALPLASRGVAGGTRTGALTPPLVAPSATTASVSPLTSPSARSASPSDNENTAERVRSSASAKPPSPPSDERRADSVSVSVSTVDVGESADPAPSEHGSTVLRRVTPTVRAAAGAAVTPRGTSTAAALRARLVAVSSPSTPRTSTGNVTVPALTSALAPAAATAAAGDTSSANELKELRQALKDKDRELAKLGREVEKANQAGDKALKKAEDLQGKLDAEKAALVSHKKDAQVQRQELQKELRQAQTASRAAEQAQEKLQQELEKHKEKLAAAVAAAKSAAAAPGSSRVSSASTTPVMTPRSRGPTSAIDPTLLQAKLGTAERENKSLKARIHELEEQATSEATNAEAKVRQATEDAEMRHRQALEVLREQVTDRDAHLHEYECAIKALEAKNAELDAAARAAAAHQSSGQATATGASTQVALTQTSSEASPLSSSLRSPRQVVTFELSAKEATAQLQQELEAARAEVAAYKRMHEHAERRIEQLEAKLSAAEERVDAADEEAQRLRNARASSQSSSEDSTAVMLLKEMVRTLKERLASVTDECNERMQQVQERGEESATLQAALEQAEEERVAQTRQIHDLQSRAADAAEMVKVGHTRLVATQRELENTKATLASATERLETQDGTIQELQRRLASTEQRVAAMEAEEAAMESQHTASSSAAADAAQQQVDHYRKRVRQLSKKVADTERELQVLGEEYTQACAERDAALAELRSGPSDAAGATREGLASPANAQRRGSVSRSLSDALQSAHRAASAVAFKTGHGTPSRTVAAVASARSRLDSDADGVEAPPLAHDGLESDMVSLCSKAPAVEQADKSTGAWSSADRTGRQQGKSSGVDSVASLYLPVVYDNAATREVLMQSGVLRPPTTDAPARARSPQATHALNAHFFDPTTTWAVPQQGMPPPPHELHERPGNRGAPSQQLVQDFLRGRSRSIQTSQLSPSQQRDRRGAPSPVQGLSPRSAAPSVSLSGFPLSHCDVSASRLAAAFSELPAPPLFTREMLLGDVVGETARRAGTPGSGFAAAHPPGVELQFSTTAGRLLVSKRGRRLERPVFPVSGSAGNGQQDEVRCAALASMSHAIYASHMSAAGLFHLKSTFQFTVRVVRSGAGDGTGDLLVGFADRYVPMESFGSKCNAVRYSGCYYLSLRSGSLYSARQGICGDCYDGWLAAAPAAAERRWRVAAQMETGALGLSLEDAELTASGVSTYGTSADASARRRPECVARSGDEVTCTLQMEERSISYTWNGVECGVAFTTVSMSPSLYPCVELNASGAIVELL